MYKKTPDWVQCETCSEKATKSCLNCGTTYCETHLKPHMVAKRLKKHKLMDPVENLEDYICKKHERPLQFFCRDDQTCVCQFCTEGDHRGHNTVPVEEEYEEKKSQLKKTQREVQEIIQDREKMHKKFKATHALRETQKNQLKADIEDKFCLEKILPRLLEGMEEEQRAAERQAEGLIKDLQQEITEHQRRNSELEKISHTEDHLHLLQIYPTLCSPPHTRNWADVMGPHLSEEAVRRTASENEILFYKKLKTFLETLSKKAQIIAEIKQCGLHAVDVTLDPDSAHPSLILSADGKQVRHGDKRQNLPDNPERFDECICVLGKEGFSSGRFYYEVEVRGKTEWDLGVARESINRKGKITVSSQNGYWTVSLRNGKYKACAGPPVLLSLSMKPQKVGVFVDYEEGLVSFYDVENSSHIYSFTGQSLSEKLYPFFSTGLNDGGKNSAPLIISPVTNTLTS
uniref:E3 ubiquitin-protein ligase TRIM39-like n=2 Tax=Denticeps clupeoides TaxID=299321 RepID=A0AAY4A1R4_9TELE